MRSRYDTQFTGIDQKNYGSLYITGISRSMFLFIIHALGMIAGGVNVTHEQGKEF